MIDRRSFYDERKYGKFLGKVVIALKNISIQVVLLAE